MTSLLTPLTVRGLTVPNRLVMSPMTRQHSPNGVPGADVAEYYRKRAAGGTGLIITEGVAIDHPSAVDSPAVPRLHGDEALAGWRAVVDTVHAEGGLIIPQLWHVGPLWGAMSEVDPAIEPMRPSGRWGTPGRTGYSAEYVDRSTPITHPMTDDDIDAVIAGYATSARNAAELGFDGIAIHGGHGYLLDAFMWADTNRRDDRWGGDLARRAAFPAAVVAAIRAEIGDDLPIIYRFSQHKQQDYTARIAENPDELGVLLGALADAGVDVFDASIRYFTAPAFAGSDLSLAGWAKKLTGKAAMAVGSVGMPAGTMPTALATVARTSADAAAAAVPDHSIVGAAECVASGEFDLVAIGRLHLANPDLAARIRDGVDPVVFDRKRHEFVLH
ncbi:12-oxophytodienoate reductase [Gordonia aichiensis]|uniref:oxidoreductase n=1 Tax=Gordonia aichiensis TaxID=36820 RepID=UPI003262D951